LGRAPATRSTLRCRIVGLLFSISGKCGCPASSLRDPSLPARPGMQRDDFIDGLTHRLPAHLRDSFTDDQLALLLRRACRPPAPWSVGASVPLLTGRLRVCGAPAAGPGTRASPRTAPRTGAGARAAARPGLRAAARTRRARFRPLTRLRASATGGAVALGVAAPVQLEALAAEFLEVTSMQTTRQAPGVARSGTA